MTTLSSGARQPLSKSLRQFLQPLLDKAYAIQMPIYLVGGCVRDLLLKREPLDIDVLVEGPADRFARAVARAYKAKVINHPQFLTHTLVLPAKRHLDIATARIETYPESAALPVVEPASLQEDLYRRDFSVNAMALSLNPADFGHIWDPFGGVEDLRSGKIRVLHDLSFKDDPTRIFRAARFAARLKGELEWRTREWLSESVGQGIPAKLSGARLREELIPLLLEKDPRSAFRFLAQWNALEFLVPSLQWDKTHETLFGHLLATDTLAASIPVRLMALLHKVPFSKAIGSLGHLTFPQTLIAQIEQGLRLLGQVRAGELTASSMRGAPRKPVQPEIKLFLEKALRVRGVAPTRRPLEQWQRFEDSAPCLSGQDLRDLGYKPGPSFKSMFDAVRQAKWEGKLRSREQEIQYLLRTFPPAKGAR